MIEMKFKKSLYCEANAVPEEEPLKDFFVSDLSLADTVTFSPNKDRPPHNWFKFKQGFSYLLVNRLIEEAKLSNESVILDPFLGSGTTVVEAAIHNKRSIGVDILPLSKFVTDVKLFSNHVDFNHVKVFSNKIRKHPLNKTYFEFPNVPLIRKVFNDQTKTEIGAIYEEIKTIENKVDRDFLLLCLLRALEDMAYCKKDGGFVRITPEKNIKPPRQAFLDSVNELTQHSSLPRINPKLGETITGDARDLKQIKNDSIDLVITSPSYINKTDYTRVYSLELLLNFVRSFEELRDIRYNSIRSNVEARYRGLNEELLPERLILKLEELKKKHLSNPKHPEMVRGYFEDIYLTLEQLNFKMKSGGIINFVVWNSAFSGVPFEVDSILAETGSKLGFKIEKITVCRLTGTSAQQIRKYGEIPLRESIVTLST